MEPLRLKEKFKRYKLRLNDVATQLETARIKGDQESVTSLQQEYESIRKLLRRYGGGMEEY